MLFFESFCCLWKDSQNNNIVWNSNNTRKMLGRNVQMVSFEPESSQGIFFFAGASEEFCLFHFETHERPAHLRVPDTAILIKAKM